MASNGDPKSPGQGWARDFVDKWDPDSHSLKFPEQLDFATQAGSFIREALTGPPEGIAQLYSQLPPEVAQIVNEIVRNPLGTASAAANIVGQFAPEELEMIAESLSTVLETVEIAELASPGLPSTVHFSPPEIDPVTLSQFSAPANVPPSTGSTSGAIKQILLSGKGITIGSLLAAGLLGAALLGKFSGNGFSDIVGTWSTKGTSITITSTAGKLGGTLTAQLVKCDDEPSAAVKTGQCDENHPEPPMTWPLTSVSFDGHTLSFSFDYAQCLSSDCPDQHRSVSVQGQLSGDKLILGNGVLTKVR